jgi:hypothetical protein
MIAALSVGLHRKETWTSAADAVRRWRSDKQT